MKIVVAPDSFKGSLTSQQAANAIEMGIRKIMPDANIVKIPMADGGEGTLDALVMSTNGSYKEMETFDPLGRQIRSRYGILGNQKTAIIEMAETSGLLLLKSEERDPLHTTTFGTGQLIKNALDNGSQNLIIAIGGSATNDGGAGMAQALGVKFFRTDNKEITEKMCGGNLDEVASIDTSSIHPAIAKSKITIASDVKNPLLGPNGCTYVYSKQKGATAEMMEKLEYNMTVFYSLVEKIIGRTVYDIPGAGAAGGLGAGLLLFLNAHIQSGVELVMNVCNFSDQIKGADLIITGEGKIDSQTAFGKTIAGIAANAKKQQIPVIAFAGTIEDAGNLHEKGIVSCFSICPRPLSLEYAIQNAASLLQTSVEQVIQQFAVKH